MPDARAAWVREMFEDLGVLRDGVWDERMLVSAPPERLFRWGRWHEGFEGALIDPPADRDEFRRFGEEMRGMRATGEFTIPSALGAQPSALDGVSMARWMDERGFRSPGLRWYADYACRDDYGAALADTSAWAGIHYFASRAGVDEEHGTLTWPEGNGWITRGLLERVGAHVRTGAPVRRVERAGTGLRVLAGDVEYRADAVVWAAPSFLAPHVVEGAPAVRFAYSPWLTANLTLDRWPAEHGFEPAWDNVIHDSPSLGYVVATHQSHSFRPERTVWTYYHALCGRSPRGRAEPAPAAKLGGVEGCDPGGPGARASRHPRLRLARGRDADGPRDGPSHARVPGGPRPPRAGGCARPRLLRPQRPERPLALRGGPAPRHHRRRPRAGVRRRGRGRGERRTARAG